MGYTSVDKENGFLGSGIYYQCKTSDDIKNLFKDLGISNVLFTRGAMLTEEEGDSTSIGVAITTRFDDSYATFSESMSGEELAGGFAVMLVLEQNPNMLNPLFSPTSIERYTDFTQIEPTTKCFEIFHHQEDDDHTVLIKRRLEPKHDKI